MLNLQVGTNDRNGYCGRMLLFQQRKTILELNSSHFCSTIIRILLETEMYLSFQLLMFAILLDSKLIQLEGRAPLCETRYIINATYAAVQVKTESPKISPSTSEMMKSSNRYPLITITSAATVHATLCNIDQNK